MSVLRVVGAVMAPVVLVASLVVAGVSVGGNAATAEAAPGVPCRATARACVKLSTNQAWLLRDGRVVSGPVRVSHGKPGHRTPAGVFRVSYESRDHVSSIYDVPMPFAVFFNGDIAFHQGDTRAASHGCIHLSRNDARAFFDGLRPGDVVQVVR